jgi:hypothetical protein
MRAKSHRAKLAERMVQLFRDGMFVQFRAEPSALLANKRVKVTATFHLPQKTSLTSLKPVVKLQGSTKPGVPLREDPSSDRAIRSFHGDLDLSQFGVHDAEATLTLEADTGGIVARTTVQIFDRADFLKAQEELRRH